MEDNFVRILSAVVLTGLLAIPAGSVAYGSTAPPSTAVLNQEAYVLMRSGQYAASASILNLIGHIELRSADPQVQALGQHYIDLSQAVASLGSVSGDHIVDHRTYATITVQPQFDLGACLAAIAEFAAAEIGFDAACVSPAVVVIAPCIAAILILSAASYNMGKTCSG
jgi:hypothetical protein